MNIDKKKLVDLLVEKTSMERQEIKKQLDQLIDRILDAAKRGKALEIKEFGLFYFDEEGELKFEASEELSTEISFKYAGMKPVEIKPERDTAISSSKEEEDDIDEIEDEDIFNEEIEAEEFDEPEKELPETQEEDTSEIDDIFDTDQDEKDILEDPFAPEALEPLEEPVEEEPASKDEDFKPVSRQPVRKTKDHTGLFILLIIIILAVLIAGYFYYVSTQTEDPSETSQTYPAQTETMTADESEVLTNENASTSTANETGDQPLTAEPAQAQIPSEQEPVNEVSQDDVASDDGSVSMANTDQPMYGLMGSVIQEANDGYSIVIHSFNSEQNARSAAEQLRAEGYRVIVNSRTVNQNGVWRVSVGQFQTLENAQQATTRLPDPYNTQNFIQRIQLN